MHGIPACPSPSTWHFRQNGLPKGLLVASSVALLHFESRRYEVR